jgi:tetraprenyl-beta-curcumene synthase
MSASGVRRRLAERFALAGVFAGAAPRYWLDVFPQVCRELADLRRRAAAIPDPVLRRLALDAHGKRGNVEGAAAFAAFVPRARRDAVVSALVALQSTYNYVDMLSEQPSPDPVGNGRRLHEALLVALDPGARHLDYYEHHREHDDGGYLCALIDACRGALAELPGYAAAMGPARESAARIVGFQSLSLGRQPSELAALERWAQSQTPVGSDLEWRETAALCASSLSVHALIAAACDPDVSERELDAVQSAYWPWAGALHSLLDSLVDRVEDAATGQFSLVGGYPSAAYAGGRLRLLAARAISDARALPGGRRHELVIASMVGYYLSGPAPAAISGQVSEEIGVLAGPIRLVFRVKQLASGLAARLQTRRGGRMTVGEGVDVDVGVV